MGLRSPAVEILSALQLIQRLAVTTHCLERAPPHRPAARLRGVLGGRVVGGGEDGGGGGEVERRAGVDVEAAEEVERTLHRAAALEAGKVDGARVSLCV